MSRNRKYSTVIIDGVDYWEYFKFPCMVNKALDESLDFAQIELHSMRRKEPFKPFTPVTMGEGSAALSYVIANDEVTTSWGTNRFKHTITLIEATKNTERIMCGAKAFTNPLVRDYTDGKTITTGILCRLETVGEKVYKVSDYDFLYPIKGEFTESPISGIKLPLYGDFGYPERVQIADRDKFYARIYKGKTSAIQWLTYGKKFEITGDLVAEKEFSIIANGYRGYVDISSHGEGAYLIAYEADGLPSIITEVYVSSEPVARKPYTIDDVVNILLDTSETLRIGLDSPRYRFRYKSDEQRKKFQQDAPEFRFFNGRSLWECLREVGQYVHAIPRAVRDPSDGLDYIEFDELGGTKYADLENGEQYYYTAGVSAGDYTAGLEAMAANLVNLDDESDGSLTEPFGGGYQSLRAATEDARIADGIGIIKTAYPIEKIVKVEVGEFTVNNKTYEGGDITPYLFEKSEYNVLSSFSGAYPTSKTYALYYTQGSPNIEGLWYKAQDEPIEALNALEENSITNIITAVTGAPSGLLRSLDYPNLMFRVTYIPSVTARIRQYKPSYDGSFPSILAHNQSANKLSARAFGENLRGQLAMMSNSTESVMYLFQKLEDLPEPGELYDDDRYISSITARVWPDFVQAQINLSAGYNELGARVEINNAIRQFEIPAAEDRYTVLEEFVEIGKKTADDENTALTASLRTEVMKAFSSQSKGMDISLAQVTTYDEDGNAITAEPVALPVVSLAIGTSLYFGWRFESNFAAGSQSVTGGSAYRMQDYVPYGDPYYAQAHAVGFKLITGATSSDALQTAHALPESAGITGGTVMADTSSYPILWHKDSADAGCLSYQLHYITNDGLIIGDGIAYNCAAVRQSQMATSAQIYFYDHRINQLTGSADITDYIATYPITVDMEKGCITYVGAPEGFVSWAIIKSGRFMLGKNTREVPKEIYFNFKRRLL